MASDQDVTNDEDGAATEPTARESASVAFPGEPGQRLAVGGGDADAFGGSDASNHFWGLEGRDQLGGRAEDDVLNGDQGRDLLSGGGGMDHLDGGESNDTLYGGAGPDAFIVGTDTGDDVVRDFTAGPGVGDHIALLHVRWEELSVEDTGAGVKIAWDDGSILLLGVAEDDLRQSDFMFESGPQFVEGINDYGSWYIFA